MRPTDLRLHPQAASVLAYIQREPSIRRKYSELPPEEARRVALARRVHLNLAPEPVNKVERREISGPGGAFPLWIYTPANAPHAGPLPVLLHFHGGGFILCSSESHDPQNRYWANHAGCIVVSVDYRLAPEAKFPAAVEDCYAATEWVAGNAGAFGGDAARIAVAGESAGGNLAAVVAQLSRESGPPLRLQVLSVPVLDFRFTAPSFTTYAAGYGLERSGLEYFRANYLNGEQDYDDPRAAPLKAESLEGLAPALVITAGFDPLRDDGRAYADRLALAGVPVEYVCIEGMAHPFVGWGAKAPVTIEYMDIVSSAVRHAFAPSLEAPSPAEGRGRRG